MGKRGDYCETCRDTTDENATILRCDVGIHLGCVGLESVLEDPYICAECDAHVNKLLAGPTMLPSDQRRSLTNSE